MKMTDL